MTSKCKTCGHDKKEHYKGSVYHVVKDAGVRISKCEKFQPEDEIEVIVHPLKLIKRKECNGLCPRCCK